jgi:sulfonate transport system substrate-binding protein
LIYADEAKLSLPVARVLLSRYDFLNPAIDRNDLSTLRLSCAILKQEHVVSPDTDLDRVMNDLIDMSFIIKEISGEEIRQ